MQKEGREAYAAGCSVTPPEQCAVNRRSVTTKAIPAFWQTIGNDGNAKLWGLRCLTHWVPVRFPGPRGRRGNGEATAWASLLRRCYVSPAAGSFFGDPSRKGGTQSQGAKARRSKVHRENPAEWAAGAQERRAMPAQPPDTLHPTKIAKKGRMT